MGKSKITHAKIEREILNDMKREYPTLTFNEAIKVAWYDHKAIHKAGRLIYGNVWQKPKPKKKR